MASLLIKFQNHFLDATYPMYGYLFFVYLREFELLLVRNTVYIPKVILFIRALTT